MSNELQNQIRAEAKKLLESGEVTVVIGWGKGSEPFRTTPVFIEKAEDVEQLVWNPACTNNLAVYLPQMAKRSAVGIVAKPCDSRSIVTLIQEKQISRDNVKVIGLTCLGVVDDDGLKKAGVKLSDIRSIDVKNGAFEITTTSGNSTVSIADSVKEACRTCTERTPVISDVTIGETPAIVQDSPAEALDEKSYAERRAYWAGQFERCIRCYACRQVCPSCYCTNCFLDRNDVKWTSKRVSASEAWMFHVGRAMHLAGRCIGCGECERACPMDIPLMQLNREIAHKVNDLFDYTPGMDPEDIPVLGRFEDNDEDPNEN